MDSMLIVGLGLVVVAAVGLVVLWAARRSRTTCTGSSPTEPGQLDGATGPDVSPNLAGGPGPLR